MQSMKNKRCFNITHVLPEGNLHAFATQEIADTLFHGLTEIGIHTTRCVNEIVPEFVNIIVGAHLIEESELSIIPRDSIVFNSEQLFNSSKFMTKTYVEILKNFQVWDYSGKNTTYINQNLSPKFQAVRVPLGYAKGMSRLKKRHPQDIDVLFYGSLNDRRKKCLDSIISYGLNVMHLYGVYGAERDEYIQKSKLVLNLHYFESQIFEAARVSYLLANKVAVVSEKVDNHSDLDIFEGCVHFTAYERLARTCATLVHDDSARTELENQSFAKFQLRKSSHYISNALNMLRQT